MKSNISFVSVIVISIILVKFGIPRHEKFPWYTHYHPSTPYRRFKPCCLGFVSEIILSNLLPYVKIFILYTKFSFWFQLPLKYSTEIFYLNTYKQRLSSIKNFPYLTLVSIKSNRTESDNFFFLLNVFQFVVSHLFLL